MVALQAVQDERLVRLRNLQVGKPSAVGEVELGDDRLHAEAWQLRVHLDIDALVGMDAHHELVTRDVLKDARRHILELDSDLRLLLVQGLAGLHDERDPVPPLVLDVGNESAECRTPRVLRHSVVLLVRGLAAVQRPPVLSDDDILGFDGRDRSKNADLLVADVFGREGDGALHGEEGQHLQQMILLHVTDDAELVEVASATLSAKGLLERYLDIVDVVAVPRRPEERVAKPEYQDVLDHLLAKIVVDPEQLVLPPVRLQGLLQLPRAGEIFAEGLLDLARQQAQISPVHGARDKVLGTRKLTTTRAMPLVG